VSKRRRAGAGRRIAEQRFWGDGPAAGGPSPAAPGLAAPGLAAPGLAAANPEGEEAAPTPALAATTGAPVAAAAAAAERIRPTTDPAAVVRSLGAPPFVIDASVAERHLTAVYEEAVRAATALAAANGLLSGTEDEPNG
jgi:hypothetical protein